MNHPPIIDAGPGLNFFSINKERLLIGVLGPLSAPETVQAEVLRKSRQDTRFRAAADVCPTPELAAVVHRITRLPMEIRRTQPADLGETMVIAHAVVAAETGENVTVLIDDGQGARTATSEINRLGRLRAGGRDVGTIRLVNTLTVLERAAGSEHIPGKATMREIYGRLRCLDDGLPPIETTNLLRPWDQKLMRRS